MEHLRDIFVIQKSTRSILSFFLSIFSCLYLSGCRYKSSVKVHGRNIIPWTNVCDSIPEGHLKKKIILRILNVYLNTIYIGFIKIIQTVQILFLVADYICVKVQCYLWQQNFSIKTFFINKLCFCFVSFPLSRLIAEFPPSGQLFKIFVISRNK